jgi:hypothetical protein
MIGIPTQPVIALRIVDPISELRLPRDATLEQIAAAASLGQNVKIDATGPTQISIFDAGFVNLTLSSDTGRIIGQATAFRILDGRVAVLTGLAPTGIWADFVPTYENMRGSVARLKPSDYTPPRIGGKIGKFPQGGLQFAIPDGWIERDVTGQNARLYHDAALTDTLDRSGFNNGPQFVVQASQFAKDTTLKDALRQAIQAGPQDIITDVTAGGQPAAQHSFIDSSTGQTVTFVGVASADRNVLNIIRWSAPGLLDEATRPTFQAMLASVKFSDITATLVPQPTPRQ